MNICVFGASRDELDPGYFAMSEALGRAMGERGHALIFGGGAHGLMGAVARGCAETGADIVSVVPYFFNAPGILWENPTELIRMDTLNERKTIMEDRADAFIALPGGPGTFDEIFEAITMHNLGLHQKPVAFLDYDGYWQPAIALLEKSIERGFAAPTLREKYGYFTDPGECLAYLEREARHDL